MGLALQIILCHIHESPFEYLKVKYMKIFELTPGFPSHAKLTKVSPENIKDTAE